VFIKLSSKDKTGVKCLFKGFPYPKTTNMEPEGMFLTARRVVFTDRKDEKGNLIDYTERIEEFTDFYTKDKLEHLIQKKQDTLAKNSRAYRKRLQNKTKKATTDKH
jgi:hypothetical protein